MSESGTPEATLSASTPRPWFIEDYSAMDATRSRIILFVGDSDQDRADLALVVEAVNEYEALCAEVERLTAERDAELQASANWAAIAESSIDRREAAESRCEVLRAALAAIADEYERLAIEHPSVVVRHLPLIDARAVLGGGTETPDGGLESGENP